MGYRASPRKVKVMKLLLIGASGTIGQAIATALSQRHELIAVSRHSAPARVDISSPTSIRMPPRKNA